MHSSRRKEGAFKEQEMKSLGHLLKSRTKRQSRKIEKKKGKEHQRIVPRDKSQMFLEREPEKKKNKGGEDIIKEIIHKNAQN